MFYMQSGTQLVLLLRSNHFWLNDSHPIFGIIPATSLFFPRSYKTWSFHLLMMFNWLRSPTSANIRALQQNLQALSGNCPVSAVKSHFDSVCSPKLTRLLVPQTLHTEILMHCRVSTSAFLRAASHGYFLSSRNGEKARINRQKAETWTDRITLR